MRAPAMHGCGFCHQVLFGHDPVHGSEPCPLKVREVEASIAMLEAQKLSYERSAFAMNDMTSQVEAMLKSMGIGGSDE